MKRSKTAILADARRHARFRASEFGVPFWIIRNKDGHLEVRATVEVYHPVHLWRSGKLLEGEKVLETISLEEAV